MPEPASASTAIVSAVPRQFAGSLQLTAGTGNCVITDGTNAALHRSRTNLLPVPCPQAVVSANVSNPLRTFLVVAGLVLAALLLVDFVAAQLESYNVTRTVHDVDYDPTKPDPSAPPGRQPGRSLIRALLDRV